MAWMVDEYSKMVGRNAPATFTAKPVQLWGGNPVREYATGFGVAVMARETWRELFKGGLNRRSSLNTRLRKHRAVGRVLGR